METKSRDGEDEMKKQPVGEVWEPVKPRGGARGWGHAEPSLGGGAWPQAGSDPLGGSQQQNAHLQEAHTNLGGSIDCVITSLGLSPAPCH